MHSDAQPSYIVSATGRLNAPPRRVYDTIANYHTGHPRILPKQFRNLRVEKGGIGDGTVITFQVRVFGKTDTFRAEVTEPEPGRMLVEKNVAGSESVTTFIVEPGARADEAIVTITTELNARRGWAGAVERFMTERVLRPMYAEELRLLEAAAADRPGTEAATTARA
jgi:polyketide cyclase/dehydrase/lipid transport protein